MRAPSTRSLPLAALLALAAALPATVPLHAQAQQAATAAPVVDAVEVNADSGVAPGSTLDFAVRGTARGQARVQLVGSGVSIPLHESAPGVYTGRYTVARGDRIDTSRPIQATLRANGRMVISNFDFPGSFQAHRGALPAVAAAPTIPASPRIDSFGADPVAAWDPGAELRFVVDGTPGAAASVAVPGVADALPLQEARPGHYVGRYTLRLQDRVQPGPIVATLRRGEAFTSAQLATSLARGEGQRTATLGAAPATATPLVVQLLSPANGSPVVSSQVVLQGRATPNALVHAQVRAIPPVPAGQAAVALPVTEQTVQADADGNFSFTLGAQDVPPGARLELDLAASQGARTSPVQRHVLYQRQG